MSGLPVLTSDSPDMRSIVEKYDCGWVSVPHAKNIKDLIRSWTRSEISPKAKNTIEIGKRMNWEAEEKIYLDLLGI